MLRGRVLLLIGLTTATAALALAGCGGDDTIVPPAGDAGKDSSTPHLDGGTDTGTQDASDGSVNHSDAGDAGADGACDFNAFVLNSIQTQTNNTSLPSANIGQNCTDTHTLFDAAIFQ